MRRDAAIRVRPPLLARPSVVAVVLGVVFTLMVFTLVRGAVRRSIAAALTATAERHVAALGQQVQRSSDILFQARNLFEASQEVSRAEFEHFARDALERHSELRGLEWLPRVPGGDRGAFEASVSARDWPAFRVVDRDEAGGVVPAPARDEHYPILFSVSLHESAAVGFDLASVPARLAPKLEARDANAPRASPPFAMIGAGARGAPGDGGAPERIAITLPVYDTTAAARPVDLAERRRLLRGFLDAILSVPDLVGVQMTLLPQAGVVVSMHDVQQPDERLFRQGVVDEARRGWVATAAAAGLWPAPVVRQLSVAGRFWELHFEPTARFVAGERAWQPEIVLATGLLLSVLVGVVLERQARAAHALAAAESAVGQREAHFRSLVDSAGSAIVARDEEGRVTEWNPTAAAMFGLPREAVVGRRWDDEGLPAGLRPVFSTRPEPDVPDLTTIVETSSGPRTLLWRLTPIALENGAGAGMMALGRDVTDQLNLERRLADARRLESLSVLAGGVAHDFSNLLQAIGGHAELLRDATPPGAPWRHHLADLLSAQARAAELARLMRDFSGHGHFLRQPVDISRLAAEVLAETKPPTGSRVKVRQELAANLPTVSADRHQLERLLDILLANAFEALGSQGEVMVQTALFNGDPSAQAQAHGGPSNRGAYVVLQVRDNGPGIDPAVVDRIFEPFYSTRFIGRGLGLAAALGIVRGHGGVIAVASEPGSGAAFRVYLPAFAEGAPDPAAA